MVFVCTDFAVFIPELGADERVFIQVCGFEWAHVFILLFLMAPYSCSPV